ncbi:MAG TPA: DUF4175 family protein [Thermodesulfobacteriota bacterium]|nr:DUF4175 family protein [Thermodesulfobacteriota bacterium]
MIAGSEKILNKILSDLEKERKKVRVANGIVEFLLILSVSSGVITLLSYTYTNSVYFSILKFFALVAACFGLVKFLIPAVLKKEKETALALELEKVNPGLGENALNAILLAEETRSEKELGVSKSLIEAHIDEVSRKLESLDLSSAVPVEKIRSHWKRLTAAFLLSAVALVFAPKEFRSFLFSAHILPASDPDFLELADIRIEYKYPAYTKIPPEVVRRSTGDVKAMRGTQVTFEATPLNSLSGGEIVIQNGFNVPLSWEGKKLKGEFRILSDGSFYIRDKGGEFRSRTFRIIAQKDNNPKIIIKSQTGDAVEIEESDNLDIFYKATDDFGLTKLLLTWNGKKGEGSKLIKQTKGEPESIEDKFTWDFSGIESEPGEVVEVRIEAYDNDTVTGPKVGVSNAIRVKLNSVRKKHENVLALVESVLEEFLDVLADDIQYRPQNNGSDVAQVKEVQGNIGRKIKIAQSSLDKILDKMKDDDFSDYTYFLGISNIKIRVEDIINQRFDLLASLSAGDLPRLGDLITREINEFEDDVLFLDSMLKGERLRESLFYGRDMLNKHDELRELLESLKQNGDEKTRRDVQRKIEELRDLMAQLAEKLSSVGGDIREEFLNPDAFQAMNLEGTLDQVMKLIEQGKINDALELLSNFESDLQDMIAGLESGVQSFSSASLSEEMRKLSEFISKVKNLEKEEESLKKKTEGLKEGLLKEKNERENLLEFVRREKEKVEMLENILMEAKSKISDNMTEDETSEENMIIDRILNETQELRHWLQAFQFKESLEEAKEVEGQTAGLRNLSRLGTGKLGNVGREIQESADIAKEIREDLEQLEAQIKQKSMYQFAERQDEIEKETSALADDFRDLHQSDFSFPDDIGEKLDDSKGFMQGASGSLRKKEISRAISNQEEAIKSLKGARENAEGLLEKFRMSARGMGRPVPFVLGRGFQEGGQGTDTSYVDIPSPAESEIGKEFKENLMEALRDGSPKGFEELNKRYYEKIIK